MLLLMEYINPAPVDGNRYPYYFYRVFIQTQVVGNGISEPSTHYVCNFGEGLGFTILKNQGCLEWVVVHSHRLDGPI